MFIAALFTIAKIWKQLKCPPADEWIKMWYMYTMEQYSAIKKNKILPFAATWMQLEITMLSEVSQKKKDKYHMIPLIGGIQNTAQMNLATKQKQTHRHGEQTCDLKQGVWEGRRMDWDFGVGRCKLLHIEWINNKVLLYSTGNEIQSPWINHHGKQY